jgi:hypothetical protein
LLLDAYAGKAPENVQVIRKILELDKVDFPRPDLLFADGL